MTVPSLPVRGEIYHLGKQVFAPQFGHPQTFPFKTQSLSQISTYIGWNFLLPYSGGFYLELND